MIRVLVMIAVTGFLVSVVTLSTAVALGGPDIFADGVWNRWVHTDGWNGREWGWSGRSHHHGRDFDGGPETTRELAWTGGDTLDVDIPAEIQYTQAPGPGKLTITGPQGEVADVEVANGHLRFAHERHHDSDLTIVMTAPAVTRFQMDGSGKLSIAGYKQDKLSIDLSGDADVTATGEAKAVALSISGSGDADLGGVKSLSAQVDIEGSGAAKIAPTDSAKVDVSGSGDVTLLTHPRSLESNVSGSGTIRQMDGAATPTPNPSPAPPPAPKAKREKI